MDWGLTLRYDGFAEADFSGKLSEASVLVLIVLVVDIVEKSGEKG